MDHNTTDQEPEAASQEAYYRDLRRESKGVGMGLFITAEGMFFLGLIMSYLLLKAIHTAPSQEALQQNTLVWLCGSIGRTPPDQNYWLPEGLKLPVVITAMNTGVLLLSSYFMYRAVQVARNQRFDQAANWLRITAVMGVGFLLVQGYEWGRMLTHGLTTDPGEGAIFAGLFYTIIGTHGAHVLGGVIFLLLCTKQVLSGTYDLEEDIQQLVICRNYWFFVCFLWPLLFGLLYFE